MDEPRQTGGRHVTYVGPSPCIFAWPEDTYEAWRRQFLTITRWRDDRSDPLLATEAAARLLKENYEALGSWPLAITASNHGKGGVLAARTAVSSDAIEEIIEHYTGPRFDFASRNFYAEFLAALELILPTLLEHIQTSHSRPQPKPIRQG